MSATWTRSDLLAVINLVLGVLGLGFVVVQVLPSVLPALVVVYELEKEDAKGLSITRTTFQNESASQPISKLEAIWLFRGTAITSALDSNSPNAEVVTEGGRIVLRTLEPIPARKEFQTIFSSPEPFSLQSFTAKAETSLLDQFGERLVSVPTVERGQFKRLQMERYKQAFVVVALFLVAYVLLTTITKRLFAE